MLMGLEPTVPAVELKITVSTAWGTCVVLPVPAALSEKLENGSAVIVLHEPPPWLFVQ